MTHTTNDNPSTLVKSIEQLAELVDYSLVESLNCDPQATETGEDYMPRQVFSGHYVPVKPTPLTHPDYIAHSSKLFAELGFDDSLAITEGFTRLFSGDTSDVPEPILPYGWATGYALSIFGTEYKEQCPFRTGNGYGDGRAISMLELVTKGQRWEMQLKGAGRTPYCRGADGRAVLRSSIREFLVQEHMHALGVPTSRSLSLFVSKSETIDRPWYYEGSQSTDPDVMVANPVAITTRVAPSFLRVGQIELFGRRARSNDTESLKELEMIVLHLIDREYSKEIDAVLPLADKVIKLVGEYGERLTTLVVNWLRVGFCQGNFNSDNCAAGGFTLDYGPFGFCEPFDPVFQPWTGGGRHFSFFNQPIAAQKNFDSFCTALMPLLQANNIEVEVINKLRIEFGEKMEAKLEQMWANKLGLSEYDQELFIQLLQLMVQSSVDYNMFFRELSSVPGDVSELYKCFYQPSPEHLESQWRQWLENWREKAVNGENIAQLTKRMKRVNPKYTWREWLVVPAYQQAAKGNYQLVEELQQVLTDPYNEQSKEVEEKFYQLRPSKLLRAGGVSHYSCSS